MFPNTKWRQTLHDWILGWILAISREVGIIGRYVFQLPRQIDKLKQILSLILRHNLNNLCIIPKIPAFFVESRHSIKMLVFFAKSRGLLVQINKQIDTPEKTRQVERCTQINPLAQGLVLNLSHRQNPQFLPGNMTELLNK